MDNPGMTADISIAMATFNGADFLREQLDSILGQSLLPSEMVVCDDGSTDGTLDILEKFAFNAPFDVRIYRNDTRMGVAGNFEKAARLCSEKYIAFSDQDDVWLPEKLGKLHACLDDHQNVFLAFCDAVVVNRSLEPEGYNLWDTRPFSFNGKRKDRFKDGKQFNQLINWNIANGMTMLFRRELLEFTVPFNPLWNHDGWVAAVSTGLGYRCLVVDEPLILYRQHENQGIGVLKGNRFRKFFRILPLWDEYLQGQKTKMQSLLDHLREQDAPVEHLGILSDKITFLDQRIHKLYQPRIRRLPTLLNIFRRGHYAKYGRYILTGLGMDLLFSKTLKDSQGNPDSSAMQT